LAGKGIDMWQTGDAQQSCEEKGCFSSDKASEDFFRPRLIGFFFEWPRFGLPALPE